MYKEFSVKRLYEMKHANSYDKRSGNYHAEKVKQREAVLTSQQRFFTQARESLTGLCWEVGDWLLSPECPV